MKDYLFIIRSKPTTPEMIASVTPQWGAVIPKWVQQGHFVESSLLYNEGNFISGNERTRENGPVINGEYAVVAVLKMKADNLEQAIELAKECPTLNLGATVEVREVQPKHVAPASN